MNRVQNYVVADDQTTISLVIVVVTAIVQVYDI